MSVSVTFSDHPPAVSGEVLYDGTFPSDRGTKSEVLEELLALLAERGLLEDSRNRMQSRLCLDEALVNAVTHGNGGDPEKEVSVKLFVDEEKRSWGAVVSDEGNGFDRNDIPDPNKPENRLKESGRGVVMMENFMDELVYFNGGSAVFMEKQVD